MVTDRSTRSSSDWSCQDEDQDKEDEDQNGLDWDHCRSIIIIVLGVSHYLNLNGEEEAPRRIQRTGIRGRFRESSEYAISMCN
jgi:hypothetical protein